MYPKDGHLCSVIFCLIRTIAHRAGSLSLSVERGGEIIEPPVSVAIGAAE